MDVPPRPQSTPWQTGLTAIQANEAHSAAGQRLIRLTIDVGPARLVSDWTPRELAGLALNLYRAATGVDLPDAVELVGLVDPGPFLGGGE